MQSTLKATAKLQIVLKKTYRSDGDNRFRSPRTAENLLIILTVYLQEETSATEKEERK